MKEAKMTKELANEMQGIINEVYSWLSDIEYDADPSLYDVLCSSCNTIEDIADEMRKTIEPFCSDDTAKFTTDIADDLRDDADRLRDYAGYISEDCRGNVSEYDDFNPADYEDRLFGIGQRLMNILKPFKVKDDFTNKRIRECWKAFTEQCSKDDWALGVSLINTPDRANNNRLDWVLRFHAMDREERDSIACYQKKIADFFSKFFGHKCTVWTCHEYSKYDGCQSYIRRP